MPFLAPLVDWTKAARAAVEPPFCARTSAGTPARTPLSTLEPLMEPTFVRFWSFLGIQHTVWPFTTWACFGFRTLIEYHTVTLTHCKLVHIVVLVVPPLSAPEPPFCTLSAHPSCAGTPFLHPFLRGFCAKAFCTKGTKCIHQVQIWLLKRACSAFFFGPLWPRRRQAFAGPLSVVTPGQGSPCSTQW